MRAVLILLLAFLAAADAAAQIPMPTPRPAAVKRVSAPLPARPMQAGDVPLPDAAAAACTDLIAGGYAVVDLTVSVSGLSGGELCGDEAPVRLSAVRLHDGGRVELRPAALARCETAHVFARWVREDLAAAARHAGGRIERLEIAASYSCRPRNNVAGARMSEHGLANAIDVGALVLAGGRRIAIDDENAPALLLAEMRRSACTRFTTVLGPGADAAHAHHLHVDLARRRGGYRLCQWTMPDWPLP